MKKLMLSSVAALTLGACSILPSPQKVDTYRLAPSQMQAVFSPSNLSLSIPIPYAGRFLNHHRLAVVLEHNEVQAYAGMRWEDTLPSLYRDRLVEDFRRSNAYKAVLTADEKVDVDRILRVDIRAYQLQYKEGKPYVVVAIDATLVNGINSDVIASSSFEQTQAIEVVDMAHIMPALTHLTNIVNEQLIQWARSQQ